MIKLNVGNLWTDKFLDKVIELNEKHGAETKVESMFGSISGLTPTARSMDRIPYLGTSEIARYVKRARANEIDIRYTLNASCIGSLQDFKMQWELSLKDIVLHLHDIGVHTWVVTSPLLMMLMRETLPNDFLEISTICEISNRQEAERWKELGAGGVNLSTAINRKPSAIKEVVASGLVVSILANEACLYKCPWRRECYNLSSHDSKRADDLFANYPFGYCNSLRLQFPVEWVKSRMVLRSWMVIYREEYNVEWFKVSFRTHPYEVAVPILEYYMKQEDPANLLDLWPTIAHLGHTAEPKDLQFIDAKRFTPGVLDRLVTAGELCEKQECGVTCSVCHNLAGFTFDHKK